MVDAGIVFEIVVGWAGCARCGRECTVKAVCVTLCAESVVVFGGGVIIGGARGTA